VWPASAAHARPLLVRGGQDRIRVRRPKDEAHAQGQQVAQRDRPLRGHGVVERPIEPPENPAVDHFRQQPIHRLVDAPLERMVPGSRAAGPARTVLCGQGDNLAVHAALTRVQPGEVLVLAMPEPEPVALVGEVIAVQAKVRGTAGLLIDGAIRDADELSELGLPVWARYIHARGAAKEEAGELDVPVTVGGVRVEPGDVVVMDGAVVVPAGRAEEVLEAGRRREADEAAMMDELRAGALTLDLMGLREKLGVEGD
jgi:4-hydroxy-4-methyl-2-oxoglutarate aldolase